METSFSAPANQSESKRDLNPKLRAVACNDMVFQNDRLLSIQMTRVLIPLCLNVELSIPQALNDKLVALCALVNVLDVVCGV